MATAELSAVIRNSGSTAINQPFTVAFYADAALTQLIATAAVEPPLGGCATAVAKAHVEWEDLAKGNHPFWVKLDDQDVIEEESKADNVANGQVAVTGPVYNLHLSVLSEGDATGGSVTVEPEGFVYPQGTEVKLTAVPASGWRLARWSGSVISTVPQITVTVDQDIFLEATFEREHYQLVTQVNGQGTIRITPAAPYYLYGEKVTLEAQPADGWRFVQWQGDRAGSDPQIAYTFDGDLNLVAIFAEAGPPPTPPAQQAHRAFQPAVFAAP